MGLDELETKHVRRKHKQHAIKKQSGVLTTPAQNLRHGNESSSTRLTVATSSKFSLWIQTILVVRCKLRLTGSTKSLNSGTLAGSTGLSTRNSTQFSTFHSRFQMTGTRLVKQIYMPMQNAKNERFFVKHYNSLQKGMTWGW